MRSEDRHNSGQRKYPPFFERIVPIALGILIFAILILVLIIFAVVIGWLPGYAGALPSILSSPI
jgi:hypothetical protein